jgi:hypothetical protein
MSLGRSARCKGSLAALTLAAPLLLGGCGKTPVLLGLDVTSGPEQTLVMVRGKNLFLASVVWDAGLPTEREIPGSFLGASSWVPTVSSVLSFCFFCFLLRTSMDKVGWLGGGGGLEWGGGGATTPSNYPHQLLYISTFTLACLLH